MKSFNYHQTTEIIFGRGRISELATVAGKWGTRALLVTTDSSSSFLTSLFNSVIKDLSGAGIEVCHFKGVVPNPTVKSISEGSAMARSFKADLIIGIGGGSSMDSAKAIAVEATHEGTCWDYLFYKNQPTDKTLPVIAVSTTSGTGSQVTQVAVVTHSDTRDKSALYNNLIYPRVCIIDAELMISTPSFITACTGFDAFCHAFESLLHPNKGAYVELMAWEAVHIVCATLPKLLKDLNNIDHREQMAWADTLAGLCIASAGVTLPHGIGMAIGGMYPRVAHGEALALIYPEFCAFTWASAIPEFARLSRLLNPALHASSDEDAAAASGREIEQLLQQIGLAKKLRDVHIPEHELDTLARQSMVLPDYKNNPRVPGCGEIAAILKNSF